MNWNAIETQWSHLKSDLKAHWSKLTDDDIEHLAAKRDKLVTKLVERYGVVKEEAERQVDEWSHKVDAIKAEAKARIHKAQH
jgi:uncharacterized protein YjbJ (UPF0337 family)